MAEFAAKEQWPELVGKTGEQAKAAVLAERPELNVHVVPEMSPCTMDYRLDRVRIFINNEGKVVVPPQTG